MEVRDLCDPHAAVVLASVTSNEPDDAPGPVDGHTTGDIADADIGTPDAEIALRAERDGAGPGRTYMVTYQAIDASGNAALALAPIVVPHDQGSDPGPRSMRLEPDGTRGIGRGTWTGASGARIYDAISGDPP